METCCSLDHVEPRSAIGADDGTDRIEVGEEGGCRGGVGHADRRGGGGWKGIWRDGWCEAVVFSMAKFGDEKIELVVVFNKLSVFEFTSVLWLNDQRT